MQNILIVEDDKNINKGLCFDLTAEGYETLSAENGKMAIEILQSNQINLALLDVNLPDIDGFSLCEKIKRDYDIPVIFLTARDLEHEELLGFENGADDYITKPFSMPLLRKRIAVVLKRYNKTSANEYSDGFLSIDFDKLIANKNGDIIMLTPTEYKLIKIFISNAGNVLTRKLLLEKMWDNDGNFVDEHALTVNINRLRNKLEDDKHKYIKTVYGIGYSWAGEKL